MADYYGTEGDDVLDQTRLNGASPIYGLGGNDTISSVNGHMIGGPGNDTLIALGLFATATYWNSPKGVVVDLQSGTAQDGYGTVDTLQNVHVVHGSNFADQLFGTSGNDTFHGHGGNDLIDGRGGIDVIQFINTTPEGHTFLWDAAAGGLRVTDTNLADGNDGSMLLLNLEALNFGPSGGVILVNRFLPSAWTVPAKTAFDNGDAGGSARYAVGDFNGDGRMDLAFAYAPASAFSTTTTGSSPIRIVTTDATGKLISAPDLAADTAPTMANEMLTARLNSDAVDDLAVITTGQDPYLNGLPASNATYPGEAPYLLLGATSAMQLVPRSAMPSTFGHDGAVGDIDGDGNVDVYVSSISEPARAPYFLMNDGHGGFTVDRARLPLSVTSEQSPPLETFADGSWKTWNANSYPSCTLADVNGDARPDLVLMGSDGSGPSKVFLNDGTGHFSDQSLWVLPPGPYGDGVMYKTSPTSATYTKGTINLDTAALDFNGDGRLDLVAVSTFNDLGPDAIVFYRGNSVQFLQNTGTGFIDVTASRTDFSAALRDSPDGYYYMLKLADVDADGFPDLLVQRRTNDPLMPSTRILHNDGHGFFHEMPPPVGLDSGMLIPIDPTQGEYASLYAYQYGSANGYGLFNVSVSSLQFDFSQGRDFFTGALQPQTATLAADVPGRWIHGTNDANAITLSSGDERAWGYGGNDTVYGVGGDDILDGGEGLDTARFDATRANATLQKTATGWTVASAPDGTDTLANIERLKFADTNIALDIDGNAGSVAKILGAVFGKQFLANKDYVGIGLSLLDGGMSYADVVALAVRTDVFAQLAGSRSNTDFVNFVYKNVVGSLPGAAELNYFVNLLNTGTQTQASLALLACETDLNKLNIDLVGLANTGIEFAPGG